jgi:hypothetical protein
VVLDDGPQLGADAAVGIDVGVVVAAATADVLISHVTTRAGCGRCCRPSSNVP